MFLHELIQEGQLLAMFVFARGEKFQSQDKMQGKSFGISTKSLTGNTLDLRRYCKSRVDALTDPLM